MRSLRDRAYSRSIQGFPKDVNFPRCEGALAFFESRVGN